MLLTLTSSMVHSLVSKLTISKPSANALSIFQWTMDITNFYDWKSIQPEVLTVTLPQFSIKTAIPYQTKNIWKTENASNHLHNVCILPYFHTFLRPSIIRSSIAIPTLTWNIHIQWQNVPVILYKKGQWNWHSKLIHKPLVTRTLPGLYKSNNPVNVTLMLLRTNSTVILECRQEIQCQ